jgi:MFS family permease
LHRSLRRSAAVQALGNAGTSAVGLFIPLVAKDLGASDLELGLIVAAFGGALFVSAWVFGRAADVHGRNRIIALGLLCSALAAPLHVLARTPAELAAARALFGLAAGVYPAALIAYAYDAQRRPGRFAGYGALGWGVGTLAAGLLGNTPWVFAFGGVVLTAAFALALRLEPRPEARVRVPWLPVEVVRSNFPAYLAVLVRHIGAAAVWVIFPLYLVSLGASPLLIGVAYFLNTGAQFLFMGFLDRFRATPLVVGGLLASAAVFVLFWLAPTVWFVLPVQLLLALSWALLYVGALAWVMERHVERATSTGLLQSTLSLSNVVGPLVGGVVSQLGGYGANLALAAALSALAVPLFLASARRGERTARERAAREVAVQPAATADLGK